MDGSVQENPFALQRRLMETAGLFYLELKESYSDRVEILVVDPRNPALIPRLISDSLKSRVPFREALKICLLSFSLPAVVINGRLFSSGRVPSAGEVGEILKEASGTLDRKGELIEGVLRRPVSG